MNDPLDVVRFVVVNAVTGNTDRHARNVHLGRKPGHDPGRNGYLLPIDHGRCILNNDWGRPRDFITGSPIETVRGDIGNPHQLLRPLADLVAQQRSKAVDAASLMLRRVGSVLVDVAADPAWTDYDIEVAMLADRAAQVAADVDGFFDQCMEVVIA